MQEIVHKILAKMIKEKEAVIAHAAISKRAKKKVKIKNYSPISKSRKRKVRMLIFMLALVVLATLSFIN